MAFVDGRKGQATNSSQSEVSRAIGSLRRLVGGCQTRKNRLHCEVSAGVWNRESGDRIGGCDGACVHAADSLAGVSG